MLTVIPSNSFAQYHKVYGVESSRKYYFCYNKDEEYSCIYDNENRKEILVLDFDFDTDCDYNRCISLNDEIIVFIKYSFQEKQYYNYTYDVLEEVFFLYGEEYYGKKEDGSLVLKTNVWGDEITVPPAT